MFKKLSGKTVKIIRETIEKLEDAKNTINQISSSQYDALLRIGKTELYPMSDLCNMQDKLEKIIEKNK